MELPLPLIKNVVLVGGGHAHALLLRSWAMKPTAGTRLTVINPDPTAAYTGMLPGFVAGHYTRDELDYDLVRLARFAGARLVLGRATDIDRDAKTVTVPGRPPIPYDICSINVGITSAIMSIPGFVEHAVPAKPLGSLATKWTDFVASRQGSTERPKVAVIGGGVGGCELAMAMSYRLRKDGHDPVVTVIDRTAILDEIAAETRTKLRASLSDNRVEVREHTNVDSISAGHLTQTHNGATTELPVDFVVGAAGAYPFPWLSELGLATTDGFIDVTNTLQTTTDPNIFATGDCAHLTFSPRPKAGVFAVREAPYLLHNIQALLNDDALDTFAPQTDYLKLISLGKKSAGAAKFGRFSKGAAMWQLKDRIDRKFMNKLDDLAEMEPEAVPKNAVAGLDRHLSDNPPLCGGCGAKVGNDILTQTLDELDRAANPYGDDLPGDDAALLITGNAKQVITTDHLRAFTTDPYRMAKIATLHALADILAMGATPQAVLATVTLPPLGRRQQREWLTEIMAGTAESLEGTGGHIVGGHTSMGAELSIGYTMTGLVDNKPITIQGAKPGQRLLVTRPIGSGVLLAAEMRTRARGHHIAALLDELEKPQGLAAQLITAAGATAMTDVTGFGLAGHAHAIMSQSKVGAVLDLDAIPTFDGAAELAAQGIHSHLHDDNARNGPLNGNQSHPVVPLLHDPQTAGGLLCSVPADAADALLGDLHQAGYAHSAIIGTITDHVGVLESS